MRMLVCAVAAFLAGCNRDAAAPETTPPPPAELQLGTLVGAPLDGRLGGELSCTFSAGEEQLLLASGIVASTEPSQALAIRNGEMVLLTATEAEGFDGLDDGATFETEGLSVEVAPGVSLETGHEGVASNATLTARADGQERVHEGVWGCGP